MLNVYVILECGTVPGLRLMQKVFGLALVQEIYGVPMVYLHDMELCS